MAKRRQILKQLYDVKPTKADGSLDMEKIERAERIIRIEYDAGHEKSDAGKIISDIRKTSDLTRLHKSPKRKKIEEYHESVAISRRPNIVHLGRVISDDFISISKIPSQKVFHDREEVEQEEELFKVRDETGISRSADEILKVFEKKKKEGKKRIGAQKIEVSDLFSFRAPQKSLLGASYSFLAAILIFSLIIPCFSFVQRGYETKKFLFSSGESALGEFAKAQNNLSSGQFEKASLNFEESYEILKKANTEVSGIGGDFSEILRFIPGL